MLCRKLQNLSDDLAVKLAEVKRALEGFIREHDIELARHETRSQVCD